MVVNSYIDLKRKLNKLQQLGFDVRQLFSDRFAEINKWFSYFDELSDDNAKYLYEKLEQLNNNVNNIIKEEIQ